MRTAAVTVDMSAAIEGTAGAVEASSAPMSSSFGGGQIPGMPPMMLGMPPMMPGMPPMMPGMPGMAPYLAPNPQMAGQMFPFYMPAHNSHMPKSMPIRKPRVKKPAPKEKKPEPVFLYVTLSLSIKN